MEEEFLVWSVIFVVNIMKKYNMSMKRIMED